ncbi:hypothetical protein [uncultured Methanobrevibacter sp.]|uniref:hypothetical protein n=1 Tax=uncultured Methanobrevibacter sp. TaxID=253161 RepID=UPI0026251F8F
MKSKNIGLDYKDENGNLRKDLKDGVRDMEKAEGFSAEEFYFKLDYLIRELDAKKSKRMAKILLDNFGPVVLFGTYFYLLKCLDKENKLEKEFDYFKEFIDYKISVFMIVNFIREI